MDQFFYAVGVINSRLRQEFPLSSFKFEQGNNLELAGKIENVTLQIITSIAESRVPQFSVKSSAGSAKTISLGKSDSREKFAVVTYILSKVYRLAVGRKTSTKRELYYENIEQFQNQSAIDRALHDVCQILDTPIWQLPIHGTAKGLIAGPVTFEMDDDIIAADTTGTVIPQNIADVKTIRSSAKWVLLVEKDAAFHKLIQDGGLSELGPCIFVTGKGYPDVGTRMLIKRLWEELRIPILALVDADPHGIGIMLVYRFGSIAMAEHSGELACPAVRWLGVHPSDITRLGIESQPLTADDRSRLQNMLTRSYVIENTPIRDQIENLLKGGVKAEMESISKFSSAYLTDTYIPRKVLQLEYL